MHCLVGFTPELACSSQSHFQCKRIRSRSEVQVVLYCEAGHSAESLKLKVKQQFGIIVPSHFVVVPLTNTRLLAPESWPYISLLAQGMGSVAVAWGGLRQMVPEVLNFQMLSSALFPNGSALLFVAGLLQLHAVQCFTCQIQIHQCIT
jgi:hypothetical protein